MQSKLKSSIDELTKKCKNIDNVIENTKNGGSRKNLQYAKSTRLETMLDSKRNININMYSSTKYTENLNCRNY